MDNSARLSDEKSSKPENGDGIASEGARNSQDATGDVAHHSPALDPIQEQHQTGANGDGYTGSSPEYAATDPKDTTFSKTTVRDATPDYHSTKQKSEADGDIEELHEGDRAPRRRFGRYSKHVRMLIHAAVFILFTG